MGVAIDGLRPPSAGLQRNQWCTFSRPARDMSLSLGQSSNYINGLENGRNYPTTASFFMICDFLGVTPAQFFEVDTKNPVKVDALTSVAKELRDEQLDHLIAMAEAFRKV